MAKTTAELGALRNGCTWVETLPPLGKNRGIRGRYRCSKCDCVSQGRTRWSDFNCGRIKMCLECARKLHARKVRLEIGSLTKARRLEIARETEKLGIRGVPKIAKRFGVSRYAVSRLWSNWRKHRFLRHSLRKRSEIFHSVRVIGITVTARKFELDWEQVVAIVRQARAAIRRLARLEWGWLANQALATVEEAIEAVEANADVEVRKHLWAARKWPGEYASSEYKKHLMLNWALDYLKGKLEILPEFALRALDVEALTRQRRRERRRRYVRSMMRRTRPSGPTHTKPQGMSTAAMLAAGLGAFILGDRASASRTSSTITASLRRLPDYTLAARPGVAA